MKKQRSGPPSRRTKSIALGAVAVGVALTSSFALSGVTPSSAYQAVLAQTSETIPVPVEPAPSASENPAADPKSDTAPAEANRSNGNNGQSADKAPKVSDKVGVAPPKPKANDQELGRTPQKKNKPVKLTDKVVLDGMTIGAGNLAAVQGVADEPGEVAGDAIRVSVTLTNTGTEPADISGVVVDLEAGPDSAPGLGLSGSGTTAFPALIEPGASATADYVFVVDPNRRSRVTISVNYSVTAPIAVFEGTAPPAKGKQ